MVTLIRIIEAYKTLGINNSHVLRAIDELKIALTELDEVEVKGRKTVDTLLGCMMAIEAIIGDNNNG